MTEGHYFTSGECRIFHFFTKPLVFICKVIYYNYSYDNLNRLSTVSENGATKKKL